MAGAALMIGSWSWTWIWLWPLLIAPPVIDPAQSQVAFRVPLLLVGGVSGQFTQVRGGVTRESTGWRVCAQIPVHSAVMADPVRRAELLGAGFFDAPNHPIARFRSTPLPTLALLPAQRLDGVLEVRGIRRPMRWQVLETTCNLPLWTTCELRLDGVLSRRAYGMRARRAVVGDDVQLRLQLRLRRDGAVPAAFDACMQP